jgi:hypothetical protein
MHILDASLYPTLGACASSQSSHVFRLVDGLINRTHEVESFLRQMVELSSCAVGPLPLSSSWVQGLQSLP